MPRGITLFLATLATAISWAGHAEPIGIKQASFEVIRVGPERDVKTIRDAARLAVGRAIVEVDAGDYKGDVAVWEQDEIVLRAVGGRVKLIANGVAAEGKAIWVMRGRQMSIEGFDFSGTRVPSKNGAGVRLEKGSLTVKDCSFLSNENGILTSNHHDAELKIEKSEFGHNGYGDGQSHNLYVGRIASLSVTGSYFHHARVGHLLKSRAALNSIVGNRFSDEKGGTASYELEFPNGGVTHVTDNLIAQSSETQNPHLISYGVEGYRWPRNELYLTRNTLVNSLPTGGAFLRVSPGAGRVQVTHNLLVGDGSFEMVDSGIYRDNRSEPLSEAVLQTHTLHNSTVMRLTAPRLSY